MSGKIMRTDQIKLIRCLLDPANLIRNLGYEPEEFQKEILYTSDRLTMIAASRGSGKSLAIAGLAVWHALLVKDNVIVIAPNLRNASEIIRYATEIISVLPLRPPIIRQNQTLIEFGSGSRIIAVPVGGEGEEFSGARGMHGSLVLLDECAFLEKGTIQSCIFPIISPFKHSQIIAASTPASDSISNWFYGNWVSGKAKTIHAPSRVIKHFDQEFIQELSEGMTEDQKKREFDAEFCQTEGSAFRFSELERLKSDIQGVEL